VIRIHEITLSDCSKKKILFLLFQQKTHTAIAEHAMIRVKDTRKKKSVSETKKKESVNLWSF